MRGILASPFGTSHVNMSSWQPSELGSAPSAPAPRQLRLHPLQEGLPGRAGRRRLRRHLHGLTHRAAPAAPAPPRARLPGGVGRARLRGMLLDARRLVTALPADVGALPGRARGRRAAPALSLARRPSACSHTQTLLRRTQVAAPGTQGRAARTLGLGVGRAASTRRQCAAARHQRVQRKDQVQARDGDVAVPALHAHTVRACGRRAQAPAQRDRAASPRPLQSAAASMPRAWARERPIPLHCRCGLGAAWHCCRAGARGGAPFYLWHVHVDAPVRAQLHAVRQAQLRAARASAVRRGRPGL